MNAWPSNSSSCARSLALAEHGSFVRAAAALHISQPALSRSIQNLERSFGSELFLRSSGGVVPTDLGRLYIERARDLLRMADELDRRGRRRTARCGAGRVAVGGGPYPSESFLGPAAARFVEQFPRVSVQLQARDWDELLRLLRSRELDFFVAETSTLAARARPRHRADALAALRVLRGARRDTRWPGAATSRRRTSCDGRSRRRPASRRASSTPCWPRTARRRGTRGAAPPFPSIECNGLAPVKRILATSDAVSGIDPLLHRAPSSRSGSFVLLGTEPWLHLQYGIVSLKGRPWTQAAERFREFVLEAEREAALEERRLVARFGPGSPGIRKRSSRRRGR